VRSRVLLGEIFGSNAGSKFYANRHNLRMILPLRRDGDALLYKEEHVVCAE
jgi:hypothetical protein